MHAQAARVSLGQLWEYKLASPAACARPLQRQRGRAALGRGRGGRAQRGRGRRRPGRQRRQPRREQRRVARRDRGGGRRRRLCRRLAAAGRRGGRGQALQGGRAVAGQRAGARSLARLGPGIWACARARAQRGALQLRGRLRALVRRAAAAVPRPAAPAACAVRRRRFVLAGRIA